MISLVIWKRALLSFLKTPNNTRPSDLFYFNYVWKMHEFVFLNLGKLHVTFLISWPYKQTTSSKWRSVGE